MTVLASITGEQDYESPAEINIPISNPVQLFISGTIGRGRVQLLIKGADGEFHPYPELSFHNPSAGQVSLMANDKVKVRIFGCTSANVEIRQ